MADLLYGVATKAWHPVLGCDNTKPCWERCWAKGTVNRLAHSKITQIREAHAGLVKTVPHIDMRTKQPVSALAWTGVVRLNEAHLTDPLRWRQPQVIAGGYHGDLFLLPDEDLDRIFAVMALCPQHAFLMLTKRPEQMREYLTYHFRVVSPGPRERVFSIVQKMPGYDPEHPKWTRLAAHAFDVTPLPNLWLGVSITNQADADERIPLLLQTPAAHRWVSIEPMLGPVDLGLNRWVRLPRMVISEMPFPPVPYAEKGVYRATANPHGALAVPAAVSGELLGIKPGEFERLPLLDQVVLGGESGPDARPLHPAWVRAVRDQCAAAGVPFFFKQWGSFLPAGQTGGTINGHTFHAPGPHPLHTTKKAAGHLLDGQEYRELAWQGAVR